MQRKIEPQRSNPACRLTLVLGFALLLITLVGCSGMVPATCGAGQHRNVSETLYFGTGKTDGQVSQVEWQAFVDEVITPRFPQGLSIWPAYGQWRSATGTIIQEDSYVLNVIHEGEPASEVAITEIMNSYKQKFQQEAVLRVESTVCVSF
jgi:hypothetical protein